MVAVVNMTPVERRYRLACRTRAIGTEVLNTDAALYGGDNRGNLGGVTTEDVPWHGRAQSALVTAAALVGSLFHTGINGGHRPPTLGGDHESKTQQPGCPVAGHGLRAGRRARQSA